MIFKTLTILSVIAAQEITDYDGDVIIFRRLKEVTNWLHGKTGLGGLVNTTLTPATFNRKIQNYGCHCYNSQSEDGRWNVMSGQGPAVDDIDQACKNLKKCRKCIHQDYPDEVMKGFCSLF